ncbi:hypothetical protein [Comamonas sp. NLF-1-9]|uniref:Kae1-like domain-containing protein n=1 Tax=Comamonas sp. NLF-1-9 TaxID=2853163 RepID=UPI001C43A1A4|nr:hypothetical protein [Comamonas sp. NLF-1-9]QXL84955.1 hypothetical protein KUD94_02915 [Comamonas sp. NLF-1-9]
MTQAQHGPALGIASRGGRITWTLIDELGGRPALLGQGQCARLEELRTLRDAQGAPLLPPRRVGAGCSSMSPALTVLFPTASTQSVDPVLAHLLAPLAYETPPAGPCLVLAATARHTVLARLDDAAHCRVLAHGLDLPAGAVFDALALALGMEAPGGPTLERLADFGNADALDLPEADEAETPAGFVFAPLRAAALARVRALEGSPCEQPRADLAAAVQAAVVRRLLAPTLDALRRSGLNQVALSGGVTRNQALRQALQAHCRVIAPARKPSASARLALAALLGHGRLA